MSSRPGGKQAPQSEKEGVSSDKDSNSASEPGRNSSELCGSKENVRRRMTKSCERENTYNNENSNQFQDSCENGRIVSLRVEDSHGCY